LFPIVIAFGSKQEGVGGESTGADGNDVDGRDCESTGADGSDVDGRDVTVSVGFGTASSVKSSGK